MSNSKRRLDRVRSVVTPTQIVLMWMEEVQQFYSLRDYCLSLKGKPDGAYPLVRLPAQAEAAVRQEMRGQAQDAVKKAVRTAERDVVFLFHLFMNSNKNVLEEQRAHLYHLLLLHETLKPLAGGEAPMVGRRLWAEDATGLVLDLYAQTGAVDYLSKRYFQERSPLFPQTAENLDTLVEAAEHIAALYNDWLLEPCPARGKAAKPALGQPIDGADVKRRSVEGATAVAEHTVRLAKAETLMDMGERRAAAELMLQHLE